VSETLAEPIPQLARGAEAAETFDALYRRTFPRVYAYVASLLRDRSSAEDVTAQAFERAYRKRGTFRPSRGSADAWVFGIARNAALDHMRSRRLVPCEEVRTSDEGYEQVGFERSQSLRSALEQLPEEQREVLVLRHVAGLSPGEIAERLDKSEGSIHGLHHRGRRALRAALIELEAGPVTNTA